jgi:hypothetical protein
METVSLFNFVPWLYCNTQNKNLSLHIFLQIFQIFIPITDLENQLNLISEDYGLILGTQHPPTHPTLVTIERKGF